MSPRAHQLNEIDMILNKGVQEYQARIRHEKKTKILSTASDMILDQGYDRTAVADIAKQAGVSLATFYKHFSTKSELLAAVCDHIVSDMAAGIDEPIRERQAVEQTLKAIARRYVEIILQPKLLKLFRLVISEVPNHAELGEIFYTRVKEPIYGRLYAYIKEKHDEGELRAPDEAKAAAVIMSLINQYFMLGPLYTAMDPVNDYDFDPEEVIERAVRNFMIIHGRKSAD